MPIVEENDIPVETPPTYAHLKTGRARAALSGAIWSSLNSLVPAVVGVGVFTVTSRYLKPAEFGIVAFAGSIAGLASAIGPAGFGEALVQRADIGKKHLDSVFWLCVGSALIIYAVLLLAAWPLEHWAAEPELALFLTVIGARVIFDLAAVVPNSLLTRSMSFDRLAIRTTAASLISAIVCLAVLAMGYGAWALALSQLAASASTSIAALIAVRWRPGWKIDRAAIADLRHFGMFATGSTFITTINIDQILIGSMLGAASLGLFGFAQRIYQILSMLLVGVLSSVSFPLLSALKNEPEKLRNVFLSVTFVSSTASFPIFIGLAAIADDLVPWAFGAQWVGAIWALKWFCVIGLLACVGVLQSALIKSHGRADWWMWYMAGNQALTAIAVLVFYRYGVSILVCALALKTCLFWPVSVVLSARLLKVSLVEYFRPFAIPAVAAFLMFLCVLTTRYLLADTSIIMRLFSELAAGGLSYCLIILIFAWAKIRDLAWVIKQTRASPTRS